MPINPTKARKARKTDVQAKADEASLRARASGTGGAQRVQSKSIDERNAVFFETLRERALSAIESGDLPALKYVLEAADPETFIEATRDDDGNTLGHLAAQKGDLPALVELTFFHGKSFGRNKAQQRISGLLGKKNDACKNLVLRDTRMGITQTLILSRMIDYLTLQKEWDPESYKAADVDQVIKEISGDDLIEGHCSGFAIYWMELMMLGRANEYQELAHKIAAWDGTDATLTPQLERAIDEWIQLITYKQQSNISDAKKQAFAVSVSQGAPEFMIGRGDKYKSFSVDYPLSILSRVFAHMLTDENVVYLSGDAHAIGVAKRGESYYLFDSNYSAQESGYDEGYSAVKFDSLAQLQEGVGDRLYHASKRPMERISVECYILESKEVIERTPGLVQQREDAKHDVLLSPELKQSYDNQAKYFEMLVVAFKDRPETFWEDVIKDFTDDELEHKIDGRRGFREICQDLTVSSSKVEDYLRRKNVSYDQGRPLGFD